MDGILLVDKPVGISSFAVVRAIKKILKIKRVGHAGTLDPLATGLLIICLGRYTKFSEMLTQKSKKYLAEIELGSGTTTDDAEGDKLFEKPYHHITREEILKILKDFVGNIEQVPPKFSAIKHEGQRAYSLARKDEEFSLKARAVHILELSLLNFEPPRIKIEVNCSKGTYVRSLARDIGNALDVGGFAKSIRRISSGAFLVEEAIKFEQLDEDILSFVKTGSAALSGMNLVELNAIEARKLMQGQSIIGRLSQPSERSVAFLADEPIAIIYEEDGFLKPARII